MMFPADVDMEHDAELTPQFPVWISAAYCTISETWVSGEKDTNREYNKTKGCNEIWRTFF